MSDGECDSRGSTLCGIGMSVEEVQEQYEWAISHGGGGILWRDDVKRVFVLREHLHESMRSAIKRQPNR